MKKKKKKTHGGDDDVHDGINKSGPVGDSGFSKGLGVWLFVLSTGPERAYINRRCNGWAAEGYRRAEGGRGVQFVVGPFRFR